jgi:hypothetical protein
MKWRILLILLNLLLLRSLRADNSPTVEAEMNQLLGTQARAQAKDSARAAKSTGQSPYTRLGQIIGISIVGVLASKRATKRAQQGGDSK